MDGLPPNSPQKDPENAPELLRYALRTSGLSMRPIWILLVGVCLILGWLALFGLAQEQLTFLRLSTGIKQFPPFVDVFDKPILFCSTAAAGGVAILLVTIALCIADARGRRVSITTFAAIGGLLLLVAAIVAGFGLYFFVNSVSSGFSNR